MIRYSCDYGVWLGHNGVQSDCFIVLSEKNPRIANTVVYIIAYVIYYIILVAGSHKKNKQPKSIVATLFQSKRLVNI